jgi:hypothetical protein
MDGLFDGGGRRSGFADAVAAHGRRRHSGLGETAGGFDPLNPCRVKTGQLTNL